MPALLHHLPPTPPSFIHMPSAPGVWRRPQWPNGSGNLCVWDARRGLLRSHIRRHHHSDAPAWRLCCAMCRAMPCALPTHPRRSICASTSDLYNLAAVASAACKSLGYQAGNYTTPRSLGFDYSASAALVRPIWAHVDGFRCGTGTTGQQRLSGCPHDERTLWRVAMEWCWEWSSWQDSLLAVQCS